MSVRLEAEISTITKNYDKNKKKRFIQYISDNPLFTQKEIEQMTIEYINCDEYDTADILNQQRKEENKRKKERLQKWNELNGGKI